MAQSSDGELLGRLDKYTLAILRVALYTGVGIYAALMVLTVVHGIGRYIFLLPVPGFIDLSCQMLLVACFLTVAYTMGLKGHITIWFIVDRFSPRTQAVIDSITYILCLVFAAVALWQAFVQGTFMMQQGQISGILHIPNFPFIYLVGVGYAMFSLAIVMHLIHLIPRAVKK